MKKTKIQHPTMFEVNDNNREHEYSGQNYIKPFAEFIQSLGYEIELDEYFSNININGVGFNITTSNASYMSKSAFTREVRIRKPQNRYILLTNSSYGASYILKIHFNEELDAHKLRSKINAAIQSKEDRDIQIQMKLNRDRINTLAIGNNYLNKFCEDHIRCLVIDRGEISFYFYSPAFLKIDLNNNILSASYSVSEMKSLGEIDKFRMDSEVQIQYLQIIAEIMVARTRVAVINPSLEDWAKTAYNQYFYTKTMSTEIN